MILAILLFLASIFFLVYEVQAFIKFVNKIDLGNENMKFNKNELDLQIERLRFKVKELEENLSYQEGIIKELEEEVKNARNQ